MKKENLSTVRNFLIFWSAFFVLVLAFIVFIFLSSSATPLLVASPLISLLLAGAFTGVYVQKYRKLKASSKQDANE